jgi:hypothetical protein
VDRPRQVVGQDGPGDALVAPVPLGVAQLLLERAVGAGAGAGVRLADEDVDELDAVAPAGVQLLQGLDRAGGRRSGVGAEVEQDRPAAPVGEAERAAAGSRQREIGCRLARQDAAVGQSPLGVGVRCSVRKWPKL